MSDLIFTNVTAQRRFFTLTEDLHHNFTDFTTLQLSLSGFKEATAAPKNSRK